MNLNPSHFGLGSVASMVGLSKGSLKTLAALGGGATAGVTASDLVQNKLLIRNGQPLIPVKYAPVFTVLFGLAAGALVKKKLHWNNVATGITAGCAGVGVSALLASVMSPSMSASAEAASAAEQAGMGPQAVSGFGFGRVFARGLRGLGGLGRVPGNRMLFGNGTPNMAGAKMFNGATVAIEQPGLLSGATVAIEPSNRFASALS